MMSHFYTFPAQPAGDLLSTSVLQASCAASSSHEGLPSWVRRSALFSQNF